MPETESYTINLKKNEYGLGLTVAGYVCENRNVRGIFVKKITKNSAADLSGKIEINDRIIKVNEIMLNDCTNFEAIEALKTVDAEIQLTFERYLSGPKFEELQHSLNYDDHRQSLTLTRKVCQTKFSQF